MSYRYPNESLLMGGICRVIAAPIPIYKKESFTKFVAIN